MLLEDLVPVLLATLPTCTHRGRSCMANAAKCLASLVPFMSYPLEVIPAVRAAFPRPRAHTPEGSVVLQLLQATAARGVSEP